MSFGRRFEARGTRWLRALQVLCSIVLATACGREPGINVEPHSQAGTPAAAGSDGLNAPGVVDSSAAGSAAAGSAATGSGGMGEPAGMGGATSGRAAVPERNPAAGHGGVAPQIGGAGGPMAAGSSAPSSPELSEPASCKRTQADASTPTIHVIGDSTASVYSADLAPRMGWAQPLQDYFQPACAKVQDKALSGRSSKSFKDEGAWTPIKSSLRAGDFVLIQFGHNDEKREDAARYTEPFGSYQRYLGEYIDDTLAARATPILLTSIERNDWSSGKLRDTHGDYPAAVRELARSRKLTLVDMTQLTHALFESIGQAATTELFLNLAPGESANYPSGNTDNTHLQEKGARVVAELALAELARQRASIAALLDHVPATN